MRKAIGIGHTTIAVCVLAGVLGSAEMSSAQDRGTGAELHGVETSSTDSRATIARATSHDADLQARVEKLEAEVAELKQLLRGNAASPAVGKGGGAEVVNGEGSGSAPSALIGAAIAPAEVNAAQVAAGVAASPTLTAGDRKTLDFLHDTTINVGLDGYYEYNFNSPVGRVNLLRAYDVLSNNFSLNQASIILEHAPNLEEDRCWGARVDLQFGQATDTLQGNPANEPRPAIYQNIFQAYGTYIAPVGKGLTIDFGKWSSSIGIEGNYTKDQMNYSRSYFFNFLPFYHMGVRANYVVNDRFTLTYWVVNGTNQAEATNGFKDELFGFTAKPAKSVTWVVNYYLGQEHPDRTEVAPYSPIPVQPGLSFVAIDPAPNGRLHIFDSYVTWQAAPKLSFALEGDYVIQRLWRDQAPGESAAPSHVDGGAAYARYEFSPRFAVAARTEYLSDRGGMFSGLNQALKETTGTFDYKLGDGFLMRYEWRRDFSNRPSFLTDTQGLLSKEQTTASVGLIWWWGQKEGAW
jgi:Putative beta-barrel porin-2, OmpL-like. bbp2